MENKKKSLSEDWTSTLIGGLVIFLAVSVFAIFKMEPRWPRFKWENADELVDKIFALDNLTHTLVVFVFISALVILANFLQGKKIKEVAGFPVLFFLTFIAMTIGGAKFMIDWGLETVIFSLLIGLFINNIFGVPDWVKGALSSELYVKIGLVLLGTTIIFDKMLVYGALGMLQSIVVVFGVWYFSFWLCGKMKIDKEMSMMLSSAVSICGVSAAVATSGAIRGDKKKLAYVVSLVLVIAVPMIIIMPPLAKFLGLNSVMAGAWIGGTIDTTGAVVATGTAFGDDALEVSSIVKFSQNVLLGIAAFIIALYWSYTNKGNNQFAEKPSAKVIWSRFPKFVLGFIVASLLFSFVLNPADHKPATDVLKKLQGLLFALGFTAIGMETNFKTLINKENRRATLVFVGAQVFNVIFTLLIAYLVFNLIGSKA